VQVRWIRVLYSNFARFCKDQEYLISLHGKAARERFDYVEGFVIVDEGLINNWRSSFFSASNPVKITSLNADGGVLYCLEITKNYDQGNADSVDEVRTHPIPRTFSLLCQCLHLYIILLTVHTLSALSQ